VRAYLRSPGNQVLFPRSARQARKLGFEPGDHLLVWGQRDGPEVTELAQAHGVPIWRMEDGFLRSVGLGSNLETPASLVVDRDGIYYDPTGPSELEDILQSATFEPAELERAAALRERIVTARLSKYNVGMNARVEVPAGRQVVLCPGQVEDDASIRLGCRDVRTNLGLLRAAREAAPDAYLIFKPHPDVLMRNRAGAVDEDEARALCDHIETRASLADCLEVADEVHTLTSLVGFEALLRGKRVVTCTASRSTPAGASPTIATRSPAAPGACPSTSWSPAPFALPALPRPQPPAGSPPPRWSSPSSRPSATPTPGARTLAHVVAAPPAAPAGPAPTRGS
jgi:capsular polysaccharide export protein